MNDGTTEDDQLQLPAVEKTGTENGSTSRAHQTTTGRLLRALTEKDPAAIELMARQLGLPVAVLERCRDEGERLDPVVQMTVAAMALTLAPEQASLAHRVYGQAQSALRIENGSVESYLTYPKRPWT